MSATALHSFVIPAYGSSPWLEECIISLREQSVPGPIIIATSTPNAHISELSARYEVPVYVNEYGGSIAADWNFAYQCATTAFVTLAHQDDVYDPNYALECLDSISRNPTCSLVFSDYAELVCTEASRTVRNTNLILLVKRIILFCFFGFSQSLHSRFAKHWVLAFGSPISCPTVMFHKAQLHDFRFDDRYTVNLDWDAWRRLANEPGRFVYMRKRAVLHRIYQGSTTTRGLHSQQRQQEDAIMFRKFWPRAIAAVFSKVYALAYRSNEVG